MRFAKRGFLVAVGFVLIVAGGLIANDQIEAAQRDRFYATRPMLRAMHDALPAPGRPGTNLMTILLAQVPLGSSRPEALRTLGSEGIACSEVISPQRDTQMVCSAWSRPAHVVPRWHIEMQFDRDDKLAGTRVLALKATE